MEVLCFGLDRYVYCIPAGSLRVPDRKLLVPIPVHACGVLIAASCRALCAQTSFEAVIDRLPWMSWALRSRTEHCHDDGDVAADT